MQTILFFEYAILAVLGIILLFQGGYKLSVGVVTLVATGIFFYFGTEMPQNDNPVAVRTAAALRWWFATGGIPFLWIAIRAIRK